MSSGLALLVVAPLAGAGLTLLAGTLRIGRLVRILAFA